MSEEAILVAHGSPAAPTLQEASMKALAVRVAMWLPGWRIKGATLAQAGSLEAAVSSMLTPLIYPFFMAEGWFTRINLPKRLADAGGGGLVQLPPFGTDPALVDIMAEAAKGAVGAEGFIIAAHGSKVSKTSSQSTYLMVEKLEDLGLGPVRAAFIEEAPFLADIAREMPRAACLPFFALKAGHVTQDIPEALKEARFKGQLLPLIGENARVAPLIAAALQGADSQ